ncbi:MAG: Crp/Fnr family transcriptional regulator [Cyanobacteria bacterium P01_G01_bin.38]
MLTSVDRLLFVRGVPIFKELRDDFLVRLASIMDELSFLPNHTIFTEGQEGRSLYIVVSGTVKVHLGNQELARLQEGACFGEMSLFDAEPRSASVTTLEACDCLMLTQQQLYEAIDETPGIAVNIIRLLSRRIRELNRELNAVSDTQDNNVLAQEVVSTLMDTGITSFPDNSNGQTAKGGSPLISEPTPDTYDYEGPWPY